MRRYPPVSPAGTANVQRRWAAVGLNASRHRATEIFASTSHREHVLASPKPPARQDPAFKRCKHGKFDEQADGKHEQ